jgi:hypothetical protein
MSEKSINVEPMQYRPASNDPHVATLSKMLEIAQLDIKGEKYGNRQRRKLVLGLPAQLGASKIDAFLNDEPDATRYPAAELLLTESIASTSLLNEEVLRTVLAGADKMKVFRNAGVAMYQTKSNALRVPLGEAQVNAPVVSEGAPIPDRTQEYGYRDFSIVKYGMKPRISYEMVEDGLVDVVAEEIFFAGAAIENKLNYDSLTALITNGTGVGSITTAGANTAGGSLAAMLDCVNTIRKAGFFPDTAIITSVVEHDLMHKDQLAYANYAGGSEVIRTGRLPKNVYGLNIFITDNGSTTVDGTNPWAYVDSNDVGLVVMEAKRAFGIAMRRDTTVNKFDDIEKELHTLTATMRCDVNYLHPAASAHYHWTS